MRIPALVNNINNWANMA